MTEIETLQAKIDELQSEKSEERRRHPKFLHEKDEIQYLKGQLSIRANYHPYARMQERAGAIWVDYKFTNVESHSIDKDGVHHITVVKAHAI